MSNTDKSRLPHLNKTFTIQVDLSGGQKIMCTGSTRLAHRIERTTKREMRQDGMGIKAQIIDLDTQEQIREALLAPAYDGPVGTHRVSLTMLANAAMDRIEAQREHEEKVAQTWRSHLRRQRLIEPVIPNVPVREIGNFHDAHEASIVSARGRSKPGFTRTKNTVRVSELAKEMGLPIEAIIGLLHKMGEYVKDGRGVVTSIVASDIRTHLVNA